MRKLVLSLLLGLGLSGSLAAQERLTEPYLERGDLQGARMAVEVALQTRSESAELLLQLGLVQVLQSVEQYSQSMSRIGLKPSPLGGMVPFLRFPVEPNPAPTVATNEAVRQALQEFYAGLEEARTTLSRVPDSWPGRVPVRLGRIRIDFDGDGVARPQEELWRLLDTINPRLGLEEQTARRFGLHLDAGDARWLEGYCHMLMGMLDTVLAYDTRRLFGHTGHLFFNKVESPYAFLSGDDEGDSVFLDAIAFLHLLDLKLSDAARMQSSLAHFQQTIRLSRRSWSCILEETDDQYEWIPNPRQHSAVPGWEVEEAQVKQWLQFLDEAESILAGTTLVPFWRALPEAQGVNLSRVFTDPKDFDAVLWLQGPGAAPYLETGRVTSQELWRQLREAFEGEFLSWAVWFN